ncbi:class I SAM-dependent methyltransferase [Ramlibacter albus]|uniref:Class I SAM-dependent methyltransferase n=1 Tax=Ramlibacter albus TaxID=2079448 RepID=A0A923M668_9BURK|nr:class I SAM-dependent methyltransferase [Ramlibacter albus]MBC5764536.1 class I SAM-dependent methyltransferase [Ramlibacter albus]
MQRTSTAAAAAAARTGANVAHAAFRSLSTVRPVPPGTLTESRSFDSPATGAGDMKFDPTLMRPNGAVGTAGSAVAATKFAQEARARYPGPGGAPDAGEVGEVVAWAADVKDGKPVDPKVPKCARGLMAFGAGTHMGPVVDLGSGNGLRAVHLARLEYPVIAVDAAPHVVAATRVAVDKANASGAGRRLDIEAREGTSVAAAGLKDGSVRGVHCRRLLPYLSGSQAKAEIAAIGRAVSPGGWAVVSIFHTSQRNTEPWPGCPQRWRLETLEDLADEALKNKLRLWGVSVTLAAEVPAGNGTTRLHQEELEFGEHNIASLAQPERPAQIEIAIEAAAQRLRTRHGGAAELPLHVEVTASFVKQER